MAHSKLTVLVVEDESLVRMAIVDRLENEGFLVLEAANADEALAILAKNLDIRLVFTDVDMPGSMDGLKLAAAVRDRWPPSRSSSHPAISMSGATRSRQKPNLS